MTCHGSFAALIAIAAIPATASPVTINCWKSHLIPCNPIPYHTIPFYRHPPKRGDPKFRACNSISSSRCSDASFIIGHVVPFAPNSQLETYKKQKKQKNKSVCGYIIKWYYYKTPLIRIQNCELRAPEVRNLRRRGVYVLSAPLSHLNRINHIEYEISKSQQLYTCIYILYI